MGAGRRELGAQDRALLLEIKGCRRARRVGSPPGPVLGLELFGALVARGEHGEEAHLLGVEKSRALGVFLRVLAQPELSERRIEPGREIDGVKSVAAPEGHPAAGREHQRRALLFGGAGQLPRGSAGAFADEEVSSADERLELAIA